MSIVNIVIRKIGLDKAVAAGTAAVAAVGVLLIPVDILSNAVVKAGLDTMFSPLQPPLGAKARIGLALLVAGTVFGIVLSAMSLLDALTRKRPAKPRPEAPKADATDELPAPPRVRRRDAHPDAPTRAPFSPLRELGAPDAVTAKPEPSGRLRRLRPEPVVEAEAVPVPQVAAPWPEGEPADIAPEPEPVAGADPFLEHAPAVEEAPFVPVPVAEQAVEPDPEIAPPATDQPEPAVEAQPRFTERRTGERRREERTGRETIPELMARLERALATEPDDEEEAAPVIAPQPVQDLAPATAPEPEPAPREAAGEPVSDDRLRSAIEHLKRVASRA